MHTDAPGYAITHHGRASALGFAFGNPFVRCRCGLARLERIHRRPWMKLFPSLRFYRCSRCGKAQLASKRAVRDAVIARRSGQSER
ncbi:hypothetical protein GFK26_26340 [Variovorax paradoxus]|uniref:Uncharacterized protein n=1 Tax=Variovorax paradoxus TaxID=34073 RepID=A0A5Q0M8A7_VARPD|nr:hypothetical protein [Variovorax paradoxus]QFZ86030.1 hypothetical protein GFK26_26340 [Variovorax paradoxus]